MPLFLSCVDLVQVPTILRTYRGHVALPRRLILRTPSEKAINSQIRERFWSVTAQKMNRVRRNMHQVAGFDRMVLRVIGMNNPIPARRRAAAAGAGWPRDTAEPGKSGSTQCRKERYHRPRGWSSGMSSGIGQGLRAREAGQDRAAPRPGLAEHRLGGGEVLQERLINPVAGRKSHPGLIGLRRQRSEAGGYAGEPQVREDLPDHCWLPNHGGHRHS